MLTVKVKKKTFFLFFITYLNKSFFLNYFLISNRRTGFLFCSFHSIQRINIIIEDIKKLQHTEISDGLEHLNSTCIRIFSKFYLIPILQNCMKNNKSAILGIPPYWIQNAVTQLTIHCHPNERCIQSIIIVKINKIKNK